MKITTSLKCLRTKFTTLLIFMLLSCIAVAQSTSVSTVSKLNNKISVNASVGQVWAVLGNLQGCSEWIPGIVSAKMDGDKRTCTTGDNKIIIEKISNYSPKKKTFKYSHLQLPMPAAEEGIIVKLEFTRN